MASSILDSTKKVLSIEEENTAFDADIMMHINSALAILNQLGVGPTGGFVIEDAAATWEDFLGPDPRLNTVKNYVYLRTRVVFDPPTGSYHLINSMNEQIKELEWRINAYREGAAWVDPSPRPAADPEVVILPVQDAWVSE